MLEILAEEDLSQVNVNSEEGRMLIKRNKRILMHAGFVVLGLAEMEAMVQEKVAEKLVLELEAILNPKNLVNLQQEPWAVKKIFTDDLFASTRKAQTKKEAFFDMLEKSRMESIQKRQKERPPMTVETPAANEDSGTAGLAPQKSEDVPEEAQPETESFDLEQEREVRSDLVSEEKMLGDLMKTINKMSKTKKDEVKAITESEEFRKELEASMEEIVAETERETNTKLDPAAKNPILDEFSDTLKDLMSKLDKAEADINKVNKEIEQVQSMIDQKEEMKQQLLETVDDDDDYEDDIRIDDFEEDEAFEESQAASVQEELPNDGDDVQVRVTDLTPNRVRGLQDSSADKKVVRRLESVIKEKLVKSGLDTGGRQIEVKLVTTADYTGVADLEGLQQGDQTISSEEQQQFQNMIYNLMVTD